MRIDHYGPNETGRDFVVGDIHGSYTLLMDTLTDIGFDFEDDRLFSVGDLVDRGKENCRVLRLALDADWFIPVRGNHEEMFFEGVLGGDAAYLYHHGKWIKRESYKSWGMSRQEIAIAASLLDERLPIAIEITHANGKRYGITHAGVPNFEWEDALLNRFYLQWDRRIFLSGVKEPVKNIDYVFHGHTHATSDQPLRVANRIYLDTSVWITKKLVIHEIGTEDTIGDCSNKLIFANAD